MVGQHNPEVWVLGFNHHAKKGSKMVVRMDLDQNLFPSTAMSLCIDVGVMINDLITSGEKGVEYSSKRAPR